MPCLSCEERNKLLNSLVCGDITIELLNGYKSIYQCVIDNSLYSEINTTQNYIQAQINMINSLISIKLQNSTSCAFKDTIRNVVIPDITNITLNTQCS